jgi:hypothetical protein
MGVLRALGLATPPPPPLNKEHPSYILNVLASEIDFSPASRKACYLLDLGVSVKENIDFFSRFSSHIHIEDLSSALSNTNAMVASGDPAQLLSDVETFAQDAGLDFIFCWDLFNYCTADQAAGLGRKLAQLAKPGTKLYALVGTHALIPATPTTFKITDGLRLVYENTSSATAPCPKRSKREMDRILPGFTRLRSFLLRNGMEEQLFVFG